MPKDSLMSLDSIPNWILKNIQFPQEAYKYGVAGIEQLCISASWDGKVFISSQLNTLNPAFEKEIINVVNKAPKCKFAGNQPQDIFKYMLIDFYRYIPTSRQKNVQRITMHTPPRLAKIPSGPFNSRDKFVEWIYTHIHIPSALINYTDTISFQYVVTTKGKVENISVIHCKSDIVKSSLESTLRASPLWKAAVADGNTLIDVVLCDNLIIKTDCDGNLMPFSRCINTVFCNTKTVPNNPNAIILNPEIKPVYKGESTFSKDIMRNIVIDKKININGSFIIEKDGTVSGVEVVQGFNDKMDSLVVHAIAQTKWTAAMQGGNFVRTVFSFVNIISEANCKSASLLLICLFDTMKG